MKLFLLSFLLVPSLSLANVSNKCEKCLYDYRVCRLYVIDPTVLKNEQIKKYNGYDKNHCVLDLNSCAQTNKCLDRK